MQVQNTGIKSKYIKYILQNQYNERKGIFWYTTHDEENQTRLITLTATLFLSILKFKTFNFIQQ